jgi:hypothetical protein
MAFINIVETDESFTWRPVDDATGEPYESALELKIVSDETTKDLRRKHTKPTFDPKTRARMDKLDDFAYVADILDTAIVSWTGVKNAKTGEELPCTSALKARLPERWKAEIFRLCVAKEAGDVVSQSAQEKKVSETISSGNGTNSIGSPAV